jgi:hypothetical protein
VPTFFQLAGNEIAKNTFLGNGTAAGSFAGDVTLEGGLFPSPETAQSTNNCLVGNSFTSSTFPANIEQTWGCRNRTTPNPGGEPFAYILELSAEAQARTQQGQSAPPEQPTMPKPCKGVPKNVLCG